MTLFDLEPQLMGMSLVIPVLFDFIIYHFWTQHSQGCVSLPKVSDLF